MTFFPTIESWEISSSAWQASFLEMSRDGRAGNEGVALWLGRRRDATAVVTHVLALRGKGIIRRPGLLLISAEIVNEATDVALELGVRLVGQIHSHGRGYGTNLSPTDLKYGISVPHYLSLVAPDYALRPNTRPEDCGVHVFMPKAGFKRLAAHEVTTKLRLVTSGAAPSVLTIGGA